MFGIKLGTVDVSEHYDKWMSALIELEKEEAESEADTNLWTAHTSVELLPYSPAPRQCNLCEKIRSDDPTDADGEKYEPLTSTEPWYYAGFSDIDVCSECYPTFYENLVNTNENGQYKVCDVCVQDIGEKPFYYTNEDARYDVCQSCYDSKRQFGVNINQSGFQTDRDHYIIAKHLDYDSIPPQLLSEITIEKNKQFIDFLDDIVRLPDTFGNILEWTLISDLDECEHHDAMAGFAVNLIDPKHPVASILSDDHGRVAMNVVYDTYEDYLREKKEFNSLNDMIAFDADLCLDDENENKENTGNFAEYVRMKRGIRFYYG